MPPRHRIYIDCGEVAGIRLARSLAGALNLLCLFLDVRNDRHTAQSVLRLVSRVNGSPRAVPEHRHNRRLPPSGSLPRNFIPDAPIAFTIHNLTAALCVPLAGRLVDRSGPQRALLPFTALLGLILVSSRILSGAIWQMYVFYLAFGVVSGGAGAMSYTDVVSHWFDRHRGLALSVMMLGMGSGAIVIPSMAQRLGATLGWRNAYSVFGLAILLIPLPVVAAFLKEKPESMGLLPDGAAGSHASTPVAKNEIGLTLREAVHTSAFWIMVSVLFLVTASVHTCFIHLPAILADRGSTSPLAAFASSLFGVGLFIGRVGCGYLLDQFFAHRVASVLFSSVAIRIAFLEVGHAIWSAFIAALLVGLGIGG
jgi:MFS family permease